MKLSGALRTFTISTNAIELDKNILNAEYAAKSAVAHIHLYCKLCFK